MFRQILKFRYGMFQFDKTLVFYLLFKKTFFAVSINTLLLLLIFQMRIDQLRLFSNTVDDCKYT